MKKAFPQSLFVSIERNPYATVASMLKHKGISSWHRRWRDFPVPNRFLGITSELADGYDDIPLPSQCAMRWLAHHDRTDELKGLLGHALSVISYESFAHDTEGTIHRLQRFLGLHQALPIPDVRTESLDKWKHQLSDAEIGQIQEIVGFSPD